jgi:transcription termination factor Rho
MDEVILRIKGTGNMELQLDRKTANKHFPAIDLTPKQT